MLRNLFCFAELLSPLFSSAYLQFYQAEILKRYFPFFYFFSHSQYSLILFPVILHYQFFQAFPANGIFLLTHYAYFQWKVLRIRVQPGNCGVWQVLLQNREPDILVQIQTACSLNHVLRLLQ